jgi:hypothetical protein
MPLPEQGDAKPIEQWPLQAYALQAAAHVRVRVRVKG